MFQKVAAFIQKVPAWILLIAAYVSVYGPDILSFEASNEPKAVAITRKIFAGIALLALLVKQSNAIAAKNDSPIAVAEVQKVVAAKKSIHPPPPTVVGVLLILVFSGCAGLKAVFTDIQVACQAEVLATSVIPPGTPVATVAGDIELACDIAVSLDAKVQNVVAAYEASQADAGVTGAYKASPLVVAKKAAKK